MMKCPNCKKIFKSEFTQVAHLNAENYGGNLFTLRCEHCTKKIKFFIERCTEIDYDTIEIARDEEALSWGG